MKVAGSSVIVCTTAAALLVALAPVARAAAPADRYTVTPDVVLDTTTGLTWQRATSPGRHNWANAKIYCQGLTLGGLTGWRLPTIRELGSIRDIRKTSPAVDGTAFVQTYWEGAAYWSATPYAPGPTSWAWRMFFEAGAANQGWQTEDNWVRCVR
jgi:hypothetical protein